MVERQKTLVVDGGAARIAGLVAENERLTEKLKWAETYRVEGEQKRQIAEARAIAAERVLAERAGGVKDGLAKAVAFVRKRLDDYVSECGIYDPETGTTEFPDGGEYAGELEEIIEGLEALTTEPAEPEGQPVTLTYKNWRGEVSERTITPKRIWFGATEWHPETQWLLTAFDVDKQADRDFALKDFGAAPEGRQEAWGWDHRFRRLDEGEIILASDECQQDDGSWRTDDGRCAGTKAPSPLYTAHRIYRRLTTRPAEQAVTDEWLRDTAMNVMLATEVEEATRILTASLAQKEEGR